MTIRTLSAFAAIAKKTGGLNRMIQAAGRVIDQHLAG
jgi:hypothetical protein